MPKTQPSTLSADGVLHLSCPRSWGEMDEADKRYALSLIGSGQYTSVELRTMLLLRLTGITVIERKMGSWHCSVAVTTKKGKTKQHLFFLQAWQVQDMIRQLEYVDSYDDAGVRLESIRGFKAVDVLLHGVHFNAYLNMEKYYQAYIATHKDEMVLKLARLLYDAPELTALDVAEQTSIVMWYSYLKKQLSHYFPHFFKPAPVVQGKPVNWMEQMNAQIRALTDGDITKEQAVLAKDCWRALTELDAKAREAEEFRKKYPKA